MTALHRALIAGLAALVAGSGARSAWAIPTPEEQTRYLARHLKPIPDDEWKSIAGDRIAQSYAIVKGDTLYDISKRLFGDPRYWPKIWALNNSTITNPHLIFPGRAITFLPGTGTQLPALTVADNSGAVQGGDTETDEWGMQRSTEWKKLPQQRWETYQVILPPQVDALGFDKSSVIHFAAPPTIELPALAESEKLDPKGVVAAGEIPSEGLSLGDVVYARASEDASLAVGAVYAAMGEPTRIKAENVEGGAGYGYPVLGQIKITGMAGDLYVGRVVSSQEPIPRGAPLIPAPGPVPNLMPVPGAAALLGRLTLDVSHENFLTAQYRYAFIDRGASDAVRPGMVFRAYLHIDPSNDKKISDDDISKIADLQVVQASDRFCLALVINSRATLADGAPVKLLLDVSDLIGAKGSFEKNLNGIIPQTSPTPAEGGDNLDNLDNGQGLAPDEEKELQQLERWKGNPSEQPPAPAPSGAPESVPTPVAPPETPPPPPEAVPTPAPAPAPETAAPPADLAPPSDVAPPPPADTSTTDAPPPPPSN